MYSAMSLSSQALERGAARSHHDIVHEVRGEEEVVEQDAYAAADLDPARHGGRQARHDDVDHRVRAAPAR